MGFDNFKATCKITEYLINLKHQWIGFILGPYAKVERVKKRLAGFDDIEVAAYCNPPLTTVNVPAYEIGRIAFKILLYMINNKSSHVEQYCLDTSIIVRGSCREL